MISPYIYKNRNLGEYFEDENVFCFFGNKNVTLDDLKSIFPDLTFCVLKQVHSDNFVVADTDTILEADGHFTNSKKTALAIITADCLPVFYYTKNFVVALHCGWRGVENELVHKSKIALGEQIIKAVVGPHITACSFEVGLDVAQKLTDVARKYTAVEICQSHNNEHKQYVDLQKIVSAQLNTPNILYSQVNTFNELDWCSYRRDGINAGRNISFVTFK